MRIHGIITKILFITALTEFYVETICDGEPPRTVKCPPQFVISTVWASYGRHLPDTCIEGDQQINTTCHANYENTISSVEESCDDSNSCTLVSSKDEYEDPPECKGVRKYLQVYYLCKSELITKAICEFSPPENVTCPEDQTIKVVDANYGRKDKWTCGDKLAENDRCLSSKSTDMVKEKCEGKNFCELEAANEVYGNPCGQTHKYLEVNFHCQAGKNINKELYSTLSLFTKMYNWKKLVEREKAQTYISRPFNR
ncbi:unnamed protein product [Porites lobata]|uniref:SUEL-type lectin domain-containing protein n=1 Tax=Porites lobata TaxID=104759 RepID=A0ABN8RB44_9CNID|nr:unnamed protein product [Porites lobata]